MTFNDREFLNLTEYELSNYIGNYKLKGESSTIEVFTKNGEIYILQNWNNVKFQILPETTTKFFLVNSGFAFEFKLNNEGIVTEMIIPVQGSIWKREIK